MGNISKAVILAAALVAAGIFFHSDGRYQVAPAGGGQAGAYVVDRTNGTVRWCNGVNCIALPNAS